MKKKEIRPQIFNKCLFAEEKGANHVYKADDTVEIQILKVGTWDHTEYGRFTVSSATLREVVENFQKNTRGVKIAVDENHEPDHKALAWYESLSISENGKALYATLSLTQRGAKLLTEGAYRYFSPELVFRKKDEETGQNIKNLLIGGAFTNRPFFKGMSPIMAAEVPDQSQDCDFILFFKNSKMNDFLTMITEFAESPTLSAANKTKLAKAYAALPTADLTPEITASFNEILAKGGEKKEPAPKEIRSVPKELEPVLVEAEPGMVSVKFSDLENLKSTAAMVEGLVQKQKETNFAARMETLVFSEANKNGVILPKSKERIREFAYSLSETQSEAFFEILDSIRKIDTQEIGSSLAVQPTQIEGADFSEHEATEYFQKTMGFNEEEAKAAAGELNK